MGLSELTIATFNTDNLDDSNSALWARRREALRPLLVRAHAQILMLEEINKISALTDLLKGTEYEGYNQVYTKTEDGKPYDDRNLVIISKWPIEETKQLRNKLVDPPKWQKIMEKPPSTEAKKVFWERPILYAKIRLGQSRILHVLVVHLKSMIPTNIEGQTKGGQHKTWLSHAAWSEGYFLSDVKRLGQALEARILIDGIFEAEGKDALIVMGGDFNAEAESTPFKAVVGSVEDTDNPDLRPTVLIPCEFNVPPDQRFSLLHYGKGSMLDHVVVSQAFYPHWTDTSIFNELLPDKSRAYATAAKFPESDHAPVVACFRVPDSWFS